MSILHEEVIQPSVSYSDASGHHKSPVITSSVATEGTAQAATPFHMEFLQSTAMSSATRGLPHL